MKYADVMSTVAGAVAVLGLWLHWISWKHERKSKRPILKVNATSNGADGWRRLRVTLRSRDNLGYKVKSARVLWPRAARIANGFENLATGAAGQRTFKSPDQPMRHCKMNLRVRHAGKEPSSSYGQFKHFGTGDTETEEIYILVHEKNRRALLSMSVETEDQESSISKRVWVDLK